MSGRSLGSAMKRLALLFACVLIAVLARPAGAQENLTQDQVAAYVAVVKADHARDRGARDEAATLYRDAMAKYRAIAQKYPDWHPEVVQYRLSYCENELAGLQNRTDGDKTADGAPHEKAPGAPDAATAEALQRLTQLETENAALRQEKSTLETDLAAVQKARLEAPELAAARDEAARLQEQVVALSNRLAAVVEEHDRTAADLVAAREKLDEAKGKLKEAQKETRQLNPLREERDRLQAELKAAQEAVQAGTQDAGQAAEAAQKLADLTQERDRLQAELKAAQSAAEAQGQAQDKVAAAERKAADLAQEREKLQGDLASCQEARDQTVQQLAKAQQEIATLAAQPAPGTDLDLPQLQEEARAMGQTLDQAARELDESREMALELLKPASP